MKMHSFSTSSGLMASLKPDSFCFYLLPTQEAILDPHSSVKSHAVNAKLEAILFNLDTKAHFSLSSLFGKLQFISKFSNYTRNNCFQLSCTFH